MTLSARILDRFAMTSSVMPSAKYASAEDLAAEKRRELRLRAAGYTVVRLLWSDLDRPTRVRGLVEAALQADRAAR